MSKMLITRRTKREIQTTILNTIYNNPGINNGKLLQKTNTSHERLKELTTELEQKGLITVLLQIKRRTYNLTSKGIETTNMLNKMSEVLTL